MLQKYAKQSGNISNIKTNPCLSHIPRLRTHFLFGLHESWIQCNSIGFNLEDQRTLNLDL